MHSNYTTPPEKRKAAFKTCTNSFKKTEQIRKNCKSTASFGKKRRRAENRLAARRKSAYQSSAVM
jgi:hypothetical protein